MDALTEDTRIALQPVLEPREVVAGVLPAIGCQLVLTDRHLVLIRDGRAFRPRSGVQVWPLDRSLSVRTTPVGATAWPRPDHRRRAHDERVRRRRTTITPRTSSSLT